MDIAEQRLVEAEADIASHSWIISTLRNSTPLGRLNLGEIRAMLHAMAEQRYTIVLADSVAEAKEALKALSHV